MSILQTERLTLRPWTTEPEDSGAYTDLFSYPEVVGELGWLVPSDLEVCEIWLEDEAGEETHWAIVRREDNRTVGYIELGPYRLDYARQDVCSLVFALLPEFWGRGYATEAATAVLAAAFAQPDISQVSADHFVGNERCARVLARLGFCGQGVTRIGDYWQRDSVTYTLTQPEANAAWNRAGDTDQAEKGDQK